MIRGAIAVGNATVFDGDLIESLTSPARIRLSSGVAITLSSGSRSRIFAEHAELQTGAIEVGGHGSYRIDALQFRVANGSGAGVRSVSLSGDRIDVSVIHGAASVYVTNTAAKIRLVGEMQAGRNLSFTKVGAQQSMVSGRLRREKGVALLADEATGIEFRLAGGGLNRHRSTNSVDGYLIVYGSVIDARAGESGQRTLLVSSFSMPRQQTMRAPQPRMLIIVVEMGEGAVNNVRERTAREALVRVEDENHKPVAGANVSVTLPDSGPSGTFSTGGRLLQTVTNAAGRASASFIPNQAVGALRIVVSAESNGRFGSAIISQINAIAAGAAIATGAAAAGSSATTSVAVVSGVLVAATASPLAAILVTVNSTDTPISSGR